MKQIIVFETVVHDDVGDALVPIFDPDRAIFLSFLDSHPSCCIDIVVWEEICLRLSLIIMKKGIRYLTETQVLEDTLFLREPSRLVGFLPLFTGPTRHV